MILRIKIGDAKFEVDGVAGYSRHGSAFSPAGKHNAVLMLYFPVAGQRTQVLSVPDGVTVKIEEVTT